MERLTEYHSGVAVIRDKRKLKEAMMKLAGYEDAEEDNDMDKITTEFAQYICDMVCGNLYDVKKLEDADRICAECKLDKFICAICNKYNVLNTFVGSQVELLLKKIAELEKELNVYKDLEEQGLLLKLPCKVGDVVYDVKEYITKKGYFIVERKIRTLSTLLALYEDFGKTVFLTKAEAEKALEEMEK